MRHYSLPYTLGTTSYIFQQDAVSNVRKLIGRVDDIELLFFESASIPDRKTIEELKEIKEQSGISFTIHLPIDLKLGSNDSEVRRNAVKKIVTIIKRASLLAPSAYILHVERRIEKKNKNNKWIQFVSDSVKKILDESEVSSKDICIENLDYPLDYLYDMIDNFNLSVCLDIGHLLLYRHDIKKYFNRYLTRVKVVHLCGIDDRGRHLSLKNIDDNTINWIKCFLNETGYKSIVTLEVFSEKDLKESFLVMGVTG